jgi:hypothetical protein
VNSRFSVSEDKILDSLTDSWWVTDENYFFLNDEQMEEVLATMDLVHHPNRQHLTKTLNLIIARFCMGVLRYQAFPAQPSTPLIADSLKQLQRRPQKITTELRSRQQRFIRLSTELMEMLDSMQPRQIDWLWGDGFDSEQKARDEVEKCYLSLLLLRNYAERTDIQVTRSTHSFLKKFVKQVVNLLEHETGHKMIRKLDPISAKEDGNINLLIDSLFAHIPEDILRLLPQKPSRYNKVVREALEELRLEALQASKRKKGKPFPR